MLIAIVGSGIHLFFRYSPVMTETVRVWNKMIFSACFALHWFVLCWLAFIIVEWLLLAAFLFPTKFLPYAGTLVASVGLAYNTANSLILKGRAVQKEVVKLFYKSTEQALKGNVSGGAETAASAFDSVNEFLAGGGVRTAGARSFLDRVSGGVRQMGQRAGSMKRSFLSRTRSIGSMSKGLAAKADGDDGDEETQRLLGDATELLQRAMPAELRVFELRSTATMSTSRPVCSF